MTRDQLRTALTASRKYAKASPTLWWLWVISFLEIFSRPFLTWLYGGYTPVHSRRYGDLFEAWVNTWMPHDLHDYAHGKPGLIWSEGVTPELVQQVCFNIGKGIHKHTKARRRMVLWLPLITWSAIAVVLISDLGCLLWLHSLITHHACHSALLTGLLYLMAMVLAAAICAATERPSAP